MTEYERFGLVFTKTRVYKFGHGALTPIFVSIIYVPLGTILNTAGGLTSVNQYSLKLYMALYV